MEYTNANSITLTANMVSALNGLTTYTWTATEPMRAMTEALKPVVKPDPNDGQKWVMGGERHRSKVHSAPEGYVEYIHNEETYWVPEDQLDDVSMGLILNHIAREKAKVKDCPGDLLSGWAQGEING